MIGMKIGMNIIMKDFAGDGISPRRKFYQLHVYVHLYYTSAFVYTPQQLETMFAIRQPPHCTFRRVPMYMHAKCCAVKAQRRQLRGNSQIRKPAALTTTNSQRVCNAHS